MTLRFKCRTCSHEELKDTDTPVLTGWKCPQCGPGHIYMVTENYGGVYARMSEFFAEPSAKPVECACSTRTLMRKGCPKRRGGVCEQ